MFIEINDVKIIYFDMKKYLKNKYSILNKSKIKKLA